MAISNKTLLRLCLRGLISTSDYWKFKKLNRGAKERLYKRRPFQLSAFTNQECLNLFRFTKAEIYRLCSALKLPNVCHLRSGAKFSGVEGFCIMLRRLSYPNRLSDLVKTFNRDATKLSRIFNYMVRKIYLENRNAISTISQPWLTKNTLQEFAEACSAAGSPYMNIVGFIDGTARPICRPSTSQKDYYSGYKKQHVLKYQSIVYPNGLIGRLDGPFKGKRHDSGILHLSGVLQELSKVFVNPDGTWFTLYGDPGYSNQKFIKVGFKDHGKLTVYQKRFNSDMSAIRVSVEYGFGKILQNFAFVDFKKNQKLLLQPLKEHYYVSAILSNCHTCLRGSQVSKYFDVNPPTLEEYLQ